LPINFVRIYIRIEPACREPEWLPQTKIRSKPDQAAKQASGNRFERSGNGGLRGIFLDEFDGMAIRVFDKGDLLALTDGKGLSAVIRFFPTLLLRMVLAR